MRVPTNSTAESVLSQITKLGSQQAFLQKQVSTNQRIFNPEDDPAAVGRLIGLDTERRQLLQFKTNAGLASNIAQSSYSGLTSLADLSDRASELATLAGDATSSSSYEVYAGELNQLLEQAVQVGNTRYGGDYLYAGTALDTAPFTVSRNSAGQVTSATYAGNSGETPLALSEVSSVSPRTSGTTNQGIADFINRIASLRDALTAGDTAGIATARTDLEDSGTLLVNAISDNGAVQLRIEVNAKQQTSRLTSLGQLASDDADVDLAATIVKLSQTTTSYEAALASGSKILQMSLLDYLR